jgi:hypothetical protein
MLFFKRGARLQEVRSSPSPLVTTMTTPSEYPGRLAALAQEQHETYHLINEADPPVYEQIKKYWNDLGLEFPGLQSPWGGVFVSWCVKQAGATGDEFKFSAAPSVFVHAAIRNALDGTGVFRGLDISSHPPGVGDIIQSNMMGKKFDYAFASSHKAYASRSAIVVEVGQGSDGLYALTISGNSGDTIRKEIVRLTPEGYIKQREDNPFICIIQTLK